MRRRLFQLNPQAIALGDILKGKGMSVSDLAKASDVSASAIQLQITYPENARRAYKIEKALGTPVWTAADQFADLRRASNFLGVDFVLTKFHPLRSAAVAKGVRHTRTVTHKEALLKLVLDHISQLETHTSK